jgi:2-dehydro-3-deoxygluconokinase
VSEQRPHVVAVGEALIEFVRGGDGRFGIGCAGDSFNVAVYLARAGIDAAFATALGDDPYSDAILALADAEGVASDLVLRTRGRLPGLTVVDADTAGTRRRFLALIEMVRQQGVKVAFDGNFRPRGWRGDLSRTRAVFMEALKRIDMALPAYDDEAVLWGDPSPQATVERLQAFGIAEIVVKNGPNSALVATGGRNEFIPVPEVVVPVDTTAAGDSFNAAYIAARMAGKGPAEAAAAAHRLAAQVIRHRGALMPRAAAAVH